MRPILFVGHDAERTGPPIYLLQLLEWIREHHPEVELRVLLLGGGPLVHRFRQLAPTTVLNWFARGEDYLPLANLSRHPGRHRWLAEQLERAGTVRAAWQLRRLRPEVLYFNSAATIKAWPVLPGRHRPRIAHIHEMDIGLRYWLGEADRRRLLASDRLLVVSPPVGKMVRAYGVPADRIAPQPGMIPRARSASLHEHSDGPLLIGACGTIDWRKGTDYFVRLVWTLRATAPDIQARFTWVGGDETSIAGARRMAVEAGVADLIEWAGPVRDASAVIGQFDVLVLTAREDAFPLVCLEAAAAGVPFLCFDTGGAADLAATGAGRVVPYPDVTAMAEELAMLCRSPSDRQQLGRAGASHVHQHHEIDVLAPRAWEAIQAVRR